MALLEVDHLTKRFGIGPLGRKEKIAVDDVSFAVEAGEVLSLIGESGSGKTTIGRMILRLLSVSEGSIRLDGVDVATYTGRGLKDYYRSVQGVFQDPFSSYNPIFKADRVFSMVKDQYFAGTSTAVWRDKVDDALGAVRLDPAQVLHKYPHQLSGGQLQRMLIARALLLEIELLVADEIISMLDASTRIDVLNLLAELKTRGLGVLFITHDLSLGNYISERTMILRRGVVVETGVTAKVLGNPQHPYSRTLVGSVPRLNQRWSEIPLDEDPRGGTAAAECPYHAEFPGVAPADAPRVVEVEPDHFVGCFDLPTCPDQSDVRGPTPNVAVVRRR